MFKFLKKGEWRFMKKLLSVFLISVLLLSSIMMITMAKDDTIDVILKRGIVKVGFCVDVPPIKFRDRNNEPAGICADFAEALARELGVKLEYVFSDWAGLIPTLLSGRSDLIITDMSTTLERAKKVNFTQPWMVTGTYIVVQNDSKWTSWKEMNKKDVQIGCILGTIGEQNIKTVLPEATAVTYNSNVEQRLALEQGRIEGLAQDFLLASREVTKSEGNFRLLPEALDADPLGFTLRSDDYHFLIWMNLWIERMKASGEYDKLMDYWIRSDEWEKDYPGY